MAKLRFLEEAYRQDVQILNLRLLAWKTLCAVLFCVAVGAMCSGCGGAPSLTYTISPATAGAHPEVVEYALVAVEEWTRAGYPGQLSVEVSSVRKGPRISVVTERPECAGGGGVLSCTNYVAGNPDWSDIDLWAGALHLPTIVGHEVGHSLGLLDLADPGAVMHGHICNQHTNEADRAEVKRVWR